MLWELLQWAKVCAPFLPQNRSAGFHSAFTAQLQYSCEVQLKSKGSAVQARPPTILLPENTVKNSLNIHRPTHQLWGWSGVRMAMYSYICRASEFQDTFLNSKNPLLFYRLEFRDWVNQNNISYRLILTLEHNQTFLQALPSEVCLSTTEIVIRLCANLHSADVKTKSTGTHPQTCRIHTHTHTQIPAASVTH